MICLNSVGDLAQSAIFVKGARAHLVFFFYVSKAVYWKWILKELRNLDIISMFELLSSISLFLKIQHSKQSIREEKKALNDPQ